MSVTPTKPKQRTQFLIKDILFQEKYKLSSTEVDLMSYIFNSMTWAFKVEGYLTITSKKFTDDLPHIGMKTVEASLRTLKQMELVEVEMIYHPIWKSNVRGIRITSRGMEYGMKLYPKEEILGGSATQNAEITMDIFKSRANDAKRDIVLLNSAMALVADKKARDIQDGIEMAREAIEKGLAKDHLAKIIKVSNTL